MRLEFIACKYKHFIPPVNSVCRFFMMYELKNYNEKVTDISL